MTAAIGATVRLRQAIGGLLVVGCALGGCTSTSQGVGSSGTSASVPAAAAPTGAGPADMATTGGIAVSTSATAPSVPSVPSVPIASTTQPDPSSASAGRPAISSVSSAPSTRRATASTGATAATPPPEPIPTVVSTTGPAPTTSVPAAGGGNVEQTVPVVPVTTKAPVSLSATAAFGTGVTATLVKFASLKTTAELPGEIAGPGVAITVKLVNGSPTAVDLGSVLVDLQDAAGTPSIPMTAPPAAPFKGSLAAGGSVTGVYVFTLATDFQGQAHVNVSYSTGAPIAVFVGSVT